MRTALLAAATALCVGAAALDSAALADDAATGTELSSADRRKLLAEAGYEADSSGKVENACGDQVSPKLAPADIGGSVGVAQVLLIPNGAGTADCYEGPGDLYLMRRSGSGFEIVFADFGRIVVLNTAGPDGVRDIALAESGRDTTPVFRYSRGSYVAAGRDITRSESARAAALP
jgi:hypothetical protein